jgi:putative nucleotidyltransferase with HDIG domain
VDCSPKDLVHVIENDPVITLKVLRVVNSAYYSLSKQITSIDHAVVFLGFNTLKNLALSIAAIGMLPTHPMAGFDGQRYLLHSLVTAGLARHLAARLPETDAHECFIAGLLHDFGKVVVAQVMPVEFKKALEMSLWHEMALHDALQDVVGFDHAEIGAMLVEKWRFPTTLVETLRYQHQVELKDTPMVACVHAANLISKRLGFDFASSLDVPEFAPRVAHRFGGTLAEIMTSIGDVNAIIEEAQLFAKS